MEFRVEIDDESLRGDLVIDGKVIVYSDCSNSLRISSVERTVIDLTCEKFPSYRDEFVKPAEILGCIIRDVRFVKADGNGMWWWTPRKLVLQRGTRILIIRKGSVIEKPLPAGSREVTEHTPKLELL